MALSLVSLGFAAAAGQMGCKKADWIEVDLGAAGDHGTDLAQADGSSPLGKSEFESPSGRAKGHTVAEEGPWTVRLMTARSTDGVTFTRTNHVIMDQANVPDMILKGDLIYLYFTGGELGKYQNATALMLSSNGGKTWVNRYMTLEGYRPGTTDPLVGDPDVIVLDDGTIRMFFTSGDGQPPDIRIFYADSQDGINFTYKGVAFDRPENVMDSLTFRVGSTWHMVTLGGLHGTSADAAQFTYQDTLSFTNGGNPPQPIVVSNELFFDATVRLYGFDYGQGELRSFTSTDGTSWARTPDVHLKLDTSVGLESEMVKDPALIRLSDGTYLMVYVTRIPK
jgi:hypothetical protein